LGKAPEPEVTQYYIAPDSALNIVVLMPLGTGWPIPDVFSTIEFLDITREAKAIVALAFRNGPIEGIHAEQPCPTCTGCHGFSRTTDDEMKVIMKNAVDQVYALLVLKTENPQEFEVKIRFGERYAARWDDPEKLRSLL
jgi:hypothetical protein